MRTVGVILAGGVGSRIGLAVPKQLLKVAGKPIIEHTLTVFQAAPEVDQIIVLMTPGFVDDVRVMAAARGLSKVTHVVEGGATRNETTHLALGLLGDEDCNVLFHDAVRPLLSQRIIRECVNALRRFEAVDVAIPSADTIVVVDEGVVTDIPDRSRLRRGQTPQGFRLSTIRRAYELAWQDPAFAATDDCTVVLRYLPEVPIHVVDGSEQNMKVTAPVDLFLADRLFQLSTAAVRPLASDTEYEEHLRGKVAVIFGASSGIGAELASQLSARGTTVVGASRSTTGTHIEDATHVQAILQAAVAEFGRVDFVVVSAGLLHTGALVDADEETVDEMIRVNHLGPVHVARKAFPLLQKTRGQLLLFTSSSYTRGRAGYSLYSSSKAAVVNLTQALADEWSGAGVRVNCINPERTATPMRTRAFGEEPAGDLLDPAVVAQTALDVLVADITGQVVDVRRPSATEGSGLPVGLAAEVVEGRVHEAELAAAADAALAHQPGPAPD